MPASPLLSALVETSRPRLGILAFHPIQYQTPLFQRLARRGNVDLHVQFLDDTGLTHGMDSGFGIALSWDIDLLGGYNHAFLRRTGTPTPGVLKRLLVLNHWIRAQDVVVVHGYGNPWMLAGAALCRLNRRPYLLRGDSKPESQSTHRVRRWLRNRVARTIVSNSAGALTIGRLNSEFYSLFGQSRQFWAPYSVDDERFAAPDEGARARILERHDLPRDRPLVLFVGKFQPLKRPLDIVRAARLCQSPLSLLFVGEGELRAEMEAELPADLGRIAGFVNQAELPAYYQAADVLVLASEIEQWGLVVNEAMAAGVIPVVSSTVGAGPDLVEGVGRIFPTGDVDALAAQLDEALEAVSRSESRQLARERAALYALDVTAAGYEAATSALQS